MSVRNEIGGQKEIRTLDTLLAYTRVPGERLQPLGHLSATGTVLESQDNIAPGGNASLRGLLAEIFVEFFFGKMAMTGFLNVMAKFCFDKIPIDHLIDKENTHA